jgi:23S rRNA pseudouridine2605 synthase
MSEVRLQVVLARAGVAARRKAEEYVKEGRVSVNGKVVTELGTKIDPLVDKVAVDGVPLDEAQPRATLVLYKPDAVVTTVSDPEGRATVLTLLNEEPFRFVPVGRLDFHTEGVLLLSTDGELVNRLLHPRYHVPKVYRVKVAGIPTEADLNILRSGVPLDDGPTRPAVVELIESDDKSSWLEMVVTEGRNRLVRRMCDAIHHTAFRVVRTEFATIGLAGLKPGQYRYLSGPELNAIYKTAGLPAPGVSDRAAEVEGLTLGEGVRSRGALPGERQKRRGPRDESEGRSRGPRTGRSDRSERGSFGPRPGARARPRSEGGEEEARPARGLKPYRSEGAPARRSFGGAGAGGSRARRDFPGTEGGDRPQRTFNRDAEGGDRPRRTFNRDTEGGDRPRRTFNRDAEGGDRPRRTFNRDAEGGDRPRRTFNRDAEGGDRPRRTFNRDAEGGDRPRRTFNRDAEGGDRPRRTFNRDTEGGDRPRRTFNRDTEGGDRPRRTVTRDTEGGDRPRRTFNRDTEGGDRPRRTFNRDTEGGDRPRRTFTRDTEGGDRPRRQTSRATTGDDRPRRTYDKGAGGDERPVRAEGRRDGPRGRGRGAPRSNFREGPRAGGRSGPRGRGGPRRGPRR